MSIIESVDNELMDVSMSESNDFLNLSDMTLWKNFVKATLKKNSNSINSCLKQLLIHRFMFYDIEYNAEYNQLSVKKTKSSFINGIVDPFSTNIITDIAQYLSLLDVENEFFFKESEKVPNWLSVYKRLSIRSNQNRKTSRSNTPYSRKINIADRWDNLTMNEQVEHTCICTIRFDSE